MAGNLRRTAGRHSSDHDPGGERDGYRGVGLPHSAGTRGPPQEAGPPESTFHRRLMNAWFSPTAVARWEPWLVRSPSN